MFCFTDLPEINNHKPVSNCQTACTNLKYNLIYLPTIHIFHFVLNYHIILCISQLFFYEIKKIVVYTKWEVGNN